jgi:S1-C subfamily serine protease
MNRILVLSGLFLWALATSALTALVVGARLLSGWVAVSPEVGAALAAIAGLSVAVVLPLYLASRLLRRMQPGVPRPVVTLLTWITVDTLLLALMAAGMRESTADALRAHGDWFLAGAPAEGVPELRAGVRWAADQLAPPQTPQTPETPEAVVPAPLELPAPTPAPAPEEPWTAKRVFAERSASVAVVRTWAPIEGELAELMSMLGMKKAGGQGSAFAVGPDLLVTNHHVIGEAEQAEVALLDGRVLSPVEVLVLDPTNDLALIRVPGANLVPVPLAEIAPVVGDPCYAIGAPLGMDQTFTAGIVSARREMGSTQVVQMQTPIAPGSSGGPLLDERGQLIGVNTATYGAGMNMAVDLRYVRELLLAPREARALGLPDARLELVKITTESELLPTDREELGRLAEMVVGGLEGCLAGPLPEGGAHLELGATTRALELRASTVGEQAEGCVREKLQPAALLGVMVGRIMAQTGSIEVQFERRGATAAERITIKLVRP